MAGSLLDADEAAERPLEREPGSRWLGPHSAGRAACQSAAIDRRVSDEALWVPTVPVFARSPRPYQSDART